MKLNVIAPSNSNSLWRLIALIAPVVIAATGSSFAAETASPETTYDAKRFKAEVTEHKNLPNFHEVHPYLYRGGAPDEEGLKEAKKKGIVTIIDLRNPGEIRKKGDEKGWAKELGMHYISLPMGPEAPSKASIDKFMDAVKQAQQHPENGAVLVHCAHGSDRTGCLIGIWRVKEDGWTYDKTYDEMRHYWFTPKFTKLSDAVRQYAEVK